MKFSNKDDIRLCRSRCNVGSGLCHFQEGWLTLTGVTVVKCESCQAVLNHMPEGAIEIDSANSKFLLVVKTKKCAIMKESKEGK